MAVEARPKQRIVAIAFATLMTVAATGAAQAQSVATETTTRDNGPKTLLEWFVGSGGEKDKNKTAEEDRLDPDRPHFPEASTTVGNGRAILEAGYTLAAKESSFSHSFPEALLRVGMFADWFEFRIGENFVVQKQTAARAFKSRGSWKGSRHRWQLPSGLWVRFGRSRTAEMRSPS